MEQCSYKPSQGDGQASWFSGAVIARYPSFCYALLTDPSLPACQRGDHDQAFCQALFLVACARSRFDSLLVLGGRGDVQDVKKHVIVRGNLIMYHFL